jgi:hypothetical protein
LGHMTQLIYVLKSKGWLYIAHRNSLNRSISLSGVQDLPNIVLLRKGFSFTVA